MPSIWYFTIIPYLDCEESHVGISKLCQLNSQDSDHTLPFTLVSSFGPPALAVLDTAMSVEHILVTSQVPTQARTNTSIAATNPLLMTTNTKKGTGSCPTPQVWVWLWLEGQSGSSLGPAQMECWSMTLVVYQELGVMPCKFSNWAIEMCWYNLTGKGVGSPKVTLDGTVDGSPMPPTVYTGWWWRRTLTI